MEGYPYMQAPKTTNPQDTTSQSQNNPIVSNVNENQQEHPCCTESLVPSSALPAHANHSEATASISNTLTGRVPPSAEIYNPPHNVTPIAACSFPQSYAPPAPSVPHFGSGLERVYHPSAHPTSVSHPQPVPYPAPIGVPLVPSDACALGDTAVNQPHIDLPPVPAPTLIQPVICAEDPPRIVENLVDLDGVTPVEKIAKKEEQKQITVENGDPAGISETESSTPPLGEHESNEFTCNVALSKENSAVPNISSSPLAAAVSGKIENNGLNGSNGSIEKSLSDACKSTVTVVEAPKQDCDGANPADERGKSEGLHLPDKNKSTIAEHPPTEKCDGKTPAKDSEHIPDAPSKQQVPDNVSCLLKNAVLVQAPSLEPVEPVEEVKPVVGGCIDDIGQVDESQENLAIEPAELFVDETGDYDATDGIEAAKTDPIVPLEVPFYDSNGMHDDVDVGRPHKEGTVMAADFESEEEPSEPDMTECGEMIGLATDDEIELKRSMCAKTVSRVKKRSIETQYKRAVSTIAETSKPENGTKYESDEKSRILLNERARHRSKKRKMHSIRIVDVKKEVLNIDEQNSENSAEDYAPARINTKKRKQAYSSSDAPYGSGFDSSCEEILDDDCLDDGARTQSERSRYTGKVAPRVNKRKAKKVEVIAGLKLPAHQQQQLQNLVLKKKQTTRDRFYDRSQDIPNDIYFENMNAVPLHILHDTSSSSSDEEHSVASKYRNTNYSAHRNRNSSSSAGRSETNHKSLQSMKMFLKIAGFRHVRYQKLWKDAHTNQERAEAILRFLQDSGLQGEPTIEKCNELRKQIQLENEAKALDVSAIISAGEGRVTRQRTKMLTTSSTPANSESQKKVETEQLPASKESLSQSGAGQEQGHGEQSAEIGPPQTMQQDGSPQPEDKLTQSHSNEDIGEQQTVQQGVTHSEDEPNKGHNEQASNVPQETKATKETAGVDDSKNNGLLISNND